MALNKIDVVTMPDISGKPPAEQLQLLYKHCQDTAVRLMQVNNRVIELDSEVKGLKAQLAQMPKLKPANL